MRKMKFYCESCGARIKLTDKVCPKCGINFEGIKCARCGYEGSEEEFINGCPECGYLPASGSLNYQEKQKRKKDLHASTYLILSVLVAAAIVIILYLWIE